MAEEKVYSVDRSLRVPVSMFGVDGQRRVQLTRREHEEFARDVHPMDRFLTRTARGKSGLGDLSTEHDKYLYGKKRTRSSNQVTPPSTTYRISGSQRRREETMPAEMRKRYEIKRGMRVQVLDEPQGLILRPIPRLVDLAGVDADKYSFSEMVKRLDRMRSEDRY